MSYPEPHEPIGNSPLEITVRNVIRWCKSRHLISVINGKLETRSHGQVLRCGGGQGGGTSASGGITYGETWDPNKVGGYAKDVVVRVQTGANGATQGVWISRKNGNSDPPVFPEPVTTGGVNSWDQWVFGPQASVDCQNGNKVIYINSSAPIT